MLRPLFYYVFLSTFLPRIFFDYHLNAPLETGKIFLRDDRRDDRIGVITRDTCTFSGFDPLPDTIRVRTASIELSAGSGYWYYYWNTGDSAASISVASSGIYWVTAADAAGCTASDTVVVDFTRPGIATPSQLLTAGDTLTLKANTDLAFSNFFNGDRFFEMSSPGPVGTAPRSFTYWLKTKDTLPMSVLVYGDASSGTSLLDLCLNLKLWYGSASGYCVDNYLGVSLFSLSHSATMARPVSDGQWHHIAYVMGEDGNIGFDNIKFYVDGRLVSNGANGVPFCGHNWGWLFNTASSPMRIGATLPGTNPYTQKFRGVLDEVAIWDGTLDSASIDRIIRYGVMRGTRGLRHLYGFEDLVSSNRIADENLFNDGIASASVSDLAFVPGAGARRLRYLWSTGDTTASIRVAPNATTEYTLRVTDGIQTFTDTVLLSVCGTAPFNPFADSISQCGPAVSLDAGAGYTSYLWEDGSTGRIRSTNRSGLHWVQATDAYGCTYRDSVNVHLLDPTIQQQDTTICSPTPITLRSSITGMSSATGRRTDLPDSLLAWYPFNGHLRDESGNGFDLTARSTYNFMIGRSGSPGSALEFTSSRLEAPSDLFRFGYSDRFTVSFWFIHNAGNEGRLISTEFPEGNFRISSYGNGSYAVAFGGGPYLYDTVATGVWVHVAYVYENRTARLYRNGTLVRSHDNSTTESLSYGNPFTIGTKAGTNFSPWAGAIAELGVWRKALSERDVRQLYQRNAPGVVSYQWHSGDSSRQLIVNPAHSDTYWLQLNDGQLTCRDSVDVVVGLGSGFDPFPDSLVACSDSVELAAYVGYASYQWSTGVSGPTEASIFAKRSGVYAVAITTVDGCVGSDTVRVKLSGVKVSGPDSTVASGTQVRLVAEATGGSSPLLDQTLSQGLISWFPFDKDLKDYSGLGNHGSGQGTVRLAKDRFGKDSSALELRAGTDLMCTSNSSQSLQSFSMSMWFNVPSGSTGELLGGFNRGQCSHNQQWAPVLIVRNDRLGLVMYDGSVREIVVMGTFKDGNWHHISASYHTGYIQIYVDGVLRQTANIGTSESYVGYWRVGGLSPNDLNNSVQGRVDDFVIHNRPLSASEVYALYADRPEFLWSTGETSDTLNITPGTSTTFHVQMSRGGLTCSDSIAVTVSATARVPGAPSILSAVPGNESVTVSFMAPADSGTSAITNYAFSLDNGTSWTLRSPASVSSPLQITGLTNGTTYRIRLRAVNAVGQGAVSDSVDATPVTVPGAPTSLSVTPGNGMVTLSFTSPSSTGGSAITNYAWSVDNGTSWTLRSPASVSSPLQIAGLTNGTTYLIRLRAVNAAGQGAVSDVITAMPVGTSTTPLLTSATPGNRQLSVYFIAPSVATGVRITNYEYTINNGGSWNPLQPASVSSPFTIAGLTNGQTYAVRIRAVTTSGRTAPSNLLQSTPITVPDYPTNIVVTGGNGSATLRFSQPYSNGGAVISNYQYSLNNGAWMDRVPAAPSSPLLITGLTNGLNYSIRIRAVNAAGSGAATWPVTIMPMTAPGMPTGLTGQAFNRSATFSFTAPTANGGVPITHYQWSLDGGQTWSITTLAARSNPSTILDLVNGRTYQVRVRAVNQAGYGPASNIVSVLPCTIPDFPTNIRLEPGNGSATMYFSAPAQTGGAPITNYQFSINNGQTWNNRSPASVSSPITVSGLTNGTRYVIKIRAVNAAGPGLESWGFSVTPRTVPAAPVITAVQPGYGSANLVLQAPANTGGAPVINYEYSLNDGLQWKARTPVHSGSNLFLTGLMNGLTYPVRVRAVNEAGAGATSAMVSVRPRSATIKPTVPGVVEMDSTTSNGGVRVFPNPITSGIINLEMIGAGDFISTIRLLTDDGKVVKINRNQPWKGGKTSLDLSEVRGLSSGLLQWSIEQRIISVRVIWKP